MDRRQKEEIARNLPVIPVVFAKIKTFIMMLDMYNIQQLAHIERYLITVDRPEYQKAYVDFMHKKFPAYIKPVAFSRRRNVYGHIAAKMREQQSASHTSSR